MLNTVLDLLKKRDMAFIEKFCSTETYMDEHGKLVNGVCRCVPAEEVLNFMHQYDAQMVEALKDKEV